MRKILGAAIDFIKGSSGVVGAMAGVPLRLVQDWRQLSISWAAFLSRRFGSRALIIVGLGCTGFAALLYITDRIAPNAPTPSHDLILKARWSSPRPSSNILIVDIDERTLAAMAPQYGRWPWSRDVLADGLQKATDLGARGVLFNVMLSDPDPSNPDGDAVMAATAMMTANAAFPLIRLNPKNDPSSKLRVSQIEGARATSPGDDPTIAAILPMFSGMLGRLGVANQRPDDDGIVRKYPVTWSEERFAMPSIVKRTGELGSTNVVDVPDLIALNWRNKEGRYARISYSDFLVAAPEDPHMKQISGAFVIIGLSAPGLGPTKPTSVMSVEDDNEILATALDDAISKTWLRTMPSWLVLALNLTIIWGLVALAITGFRSDFFNKIILALQSGMGSITMLSASYTTYLIDLSGPMSFGLGVFGVIKVVQGLDNSWSRAKPGIRRVHRRNKPKGTLVIVGYRASRVQGPAAEKLHKALEQLLGLSMVVVIDDLFGGESFVKAACADYRCQLLVASGSVLPEVESLIAKQRFAKRLVIESHVLENPWDPDDSVVSDEVTRHVLHNCAAVLETASNRRVDRQ